MSGRERKKGFPKCDSHKDCFANKDGKCICLGDNDFGSKDCPFYKNNRVADMSLINEECKAYAAMHGSEGGMA